jgi:hypothetical protein
MDFFGQVVGADGGGAYFDVLSFHYYNGYRQRWESPGAGNLDLMAKTAAVRSMMASFGVSKPLFCTEFGLNRNMMVLSDDTTLDPQRFEYQARYAAQGIVRGAAAQLPVLVWFKDLDYGNDAADENAFGFLDGALNPYPSYQAYRVAAQQLRGYTIENPSNPRLLMSDAFVSAFRFVNGSSRTLVLFTDKPGSRCPTACAGVRWEHLVEDFPNGYTDYNITLSLTSAHLPTWTGRLSVTDKLGNVTTLGSCGQSQVSLTVGPSPLYVTAAACP